VQATAFIAVMLFFTGKSFALVSLGLERLTNDLEKLAVVDDLTGLANRRALDTTLEREFRRQQRSGATLSVVLADLDHFKSVNDTYGHEAGDAVLKSVAHVLAKNVRKDIDLVGRFGGEEFMLILPETPGAQAKSLAERIRSQIETTKTAVNGAQIPVTCSLGVAEAPPDPAGPNEAREVLGRADEALYAAKRDGRNKVVRG
jgi:diguanylate cyclase (GGDEF)-like protein